MPLSVATAGFTATFTIQARDSWNNIRTLGVDSFMVRLTGPGTESHKVTPRYIGTAPATNLGRWSVGLRTTQSGNFSLAVQAVGSNGLVGTYYRDANLSVVGTVEVDETVNFVWGAGPPSPAVGLINSFSVQWTGYAAPEFSEQYTFWTEVAEPDERVKLWVDTHWVVDQWSSLSSTQPTGTTWLVGNVLYDVKVQYKELVGHAQMSLLWESKQPRRWFTLPNHGVSCTHFWCSVCCLRAGPFPRYSWKSSCIHNPSQGAMVLQISCCLLIHMMFLAGPSRQP